MQGVTYINVPFSEKNEAKRLGAVWDHVEQKKWYIPAGVDQAPFARWLPKSKNIEGAKDLFDDVAIVAKPASSAPAAPSIKDIANVIPDKQNKPEHLRLSAYLSMIGRVIAAQFNDPQWIQVEVSKLNNRSSGHAYFDFIEYDDHGGELAKARGTLWSSKKEALFRKFKTATGGDITDGMKLLLLLKPTFTAQFGLSFAVEDIDPAYTLGDMQAKLKAIRDELIKSGAYAMNKRLPCPDEFTRVAVISPQKAAGLADFTREADILADSGLCSFLYFEATFQGKDASISIQEAIANMLKAHAGLPFDAVVVIRGGGASSDLAWLNDLQLADRLARLPLPVLTGIGHQIDDTILDEVANRRFDTPSKVSAYIAGCIVKNAQDAFNDMAAITKDANRALIISSQQVDTLFSNIKHASVTMITQHSHELDVMMKNVRHDSVALIASQEHALMMSLSSIRSDAMNAAKRAEQALETVKENVGTYLHQGIKNAEQSLQVMMGEVIGLSPRSTLARGYAVLRDAKGKPVTKVSQVKKDQEIQVELSDGRITAKAVNIKESN